jgi:hypothetical protein
MAISHWQAPGVASTPIASSASNPFNARTILLAIMAGVLAFAGFLVLTAYAPEWRTRMDGGAHAYSKSAIGFAGLRQLAEKSGRPVELETEKSHIFQTGFVLVPLDMSISPEALSEFDRVRRDVEGAATLYVLPKWYVSPDPARPNWVRNRGLIEGKYLKEMVETLKSVSVADAEKPAAILRGEPDTAFTNLTIKPPANLRILAGGIDPVLTDENGQVVMGRIDHESGAITYILADPDLLNNQGIKTKENAAAALAIIDAMRADSEDTVAFDMTLASGGDKRNLLRLMFEPPFLAFTLVLAIAGILIGIHAIGRFGPAQQVARPLAFGKRALVDSAAILIARAKRENALGERYVATVRDTTAAALGASPRGAEALEAWLDTLPGGFAARATAVREAKDAVTLREAAAKLHQWKKDLVRDR